MNMNILGSIKVSFISDDALIEQNTSFIQFSLNFTKCSPVYSIMKEITFIKGIVDPPKINVVTRTMIRVVVMITWRVSSLKSKCRERAYEIAPRSPEKYCSYELNGG